MIKITEEMYSNAIPKTCGIGETVEQHKHAGLCWGLSTTLKAGNTVMDCSGCIENLSLSQLERDEIWSKAKALVNTIRNNK